MTLESLVDDMLTELRMEFGEQLLAVVLTGSALSGTLRPSADVDLFAIVDVPWHQRRRLHRSGTNIDLFLEPCFRLDRLVHPQGNIAYISALAGGRVLFDTNEIGAAYRERARRVGMVPSAPTNADWFMMRLRARDLLEKVRAFEGSDPVGCAYLLADLSVWAPQVATIVRSFPMVSPKMMVRNLRQHDEELYTLLAAMLDCSLTLSRRIDAAEHFYRSTLGEAVTNTEEMIGPQGT